MKTRGLESAMAVDFGGRDFGKIRLHETEEPGVRDQASGVRKEGAEDFWHSWLECAPGRGNNVQMRAVKK